MVVTAIEVAYGYKNVSREFFNLWLYGIGDHGHRWPKQWFIICILTNEGIDSPLAPFTNMV